MRAGAVGVVFVVVVCAGEVFTPALGAWCRGRHCSKTQRQPAICPSVVLRGCVAVVLCLSVAGESSHWRSGRKIASGEPTCVTAAGDKKTKLQSTTSQYSITCWSLIVSLFCIFAPVSITTLIGFKVPPSLPALQHPGIDFSLQPAHYGQLQLNAPSRGLHANLCSFALTISTIPWTGC